jgi:cytochrome c-type biogenesis protein CcmH/NrfG
MAFRMPTVTERLDEMANGTETDAPQRWKTAQVYAMASTCLVIGLAFGYLFRGTASRSTSPAPAAPTPASTTMSAGTRPKMPSLEDMKHMADKKAEPLLAKLKADPNNSDLLNQIGTLYKATHQFKEAEEYFQRAIAANSKNIAARTDLASCLFYQGDADGAIQQLEKSLTYDPKDANSLFNLGMIRLQGKKDPSAAIAAWQKLLKLNPTLAADKKATVEKLIAEAGTPHVSE